jgi:predicted DNA-binding transcriptional regulator AlpA
MEDDPLDRYPSLMTTSQVSEYTQIKPSTLFAWRRDGGGPPYVRLGDGKGSAIRYPREALRNYLNSRTVSSAEAVS